MRLIVALLVLCMAYGGPIQAPVKETLESSEFSSETSTVFGLLEVSPAVINTFGSVKELKIDWFFKDNKIADNMAIEVQPIWLLAFRKINYLEYSQLPYIARKLGDMTLSLGNRGGATNRMGVACSLNLYQQADPRCDLNLMAEIKAVLSEREERLMRQITDLRVKQMMASDSSKKADLGAEIKDLSEAVDKLSDQEKARNDKLIAEYRRANWNKAFVNLCGGYILSYLPKSYKVVGNTGAVWLHCGVPMGKVGLLSVLHRYLTSGFMCHGLNVRVGTDRFRLFGEFLAYLRKGSSWYAVNTGGAFSIKRKIRISLGFKFELDKAFDLIKITPSYNFNLGF